MHERCKCTLVPMRTKSAGTATDLLTEGADFYLYYHKELPEYYVIYNEAESVGWRSKKGNLDKVLPGKMIGGEIFENGERKLPHSEGRVWREADINYDSGFRNRQRILYSSDGLVFVSYDHCKTFYEITR